MKPILKNRWFKGLVTVATLVLLAFSLRACFAQNEQIVSGPDEKIDAELTLQTVTLEQPDEDGTLLWRIKAETVNYTPETEQADLFNLEGEFFQEGEVIYTVTADEGEVLQNGETLFLRGNLIANGLEDDLTIESERLKWEPKQDLLVMGNFDDESEGVLADDADDADADEGEIAARKAPVTGFNGQIEAIAQVVTVRNKDKQVDLTGGVVATSKEEPWLTFESESLNWFTEREVIEANQPLQVEQFETDEFETVSDRLTGNTGRVELADNTVFLEDGVELDALSEPLSVKSEQAVWDVEAQLVTMDTPVDINQSEERVRATANRARLELDKQIVYLIGDVRAVGEEKDTRLAADTVTWQIDTQQVEANGNVRYQQAVDPEISMSGDKAVGNIDAGTLVVTGGESGGVVTEIIPDGL